MSYRFRSAPLALALIAHACASLAADALTIPQSSEARLAERIERLERDNQELRARLDAAASTERRVKALEDAEEEAHKALDSDRISEREPELVTRLKAVEFQTLEMQKQARQIDALEGVTVAAGVTAMAQGVNSQGSASGKAASRVNYRGDISVGLPGGSLGDVQGQVFTHFRFGQGQGLPFSPSIATTPNATAFETAAGHDDSFAILAQAWYQANIPLPRDGFAPQSRAHLEVNVGKMDPFLFFDQNSIADDETMRFVDNAFVHNPLLDAGGDIGTDAYGFTPGIRVAYVGTPEHNTSWSASIGAFASGPGANFSGSLAKPLVIAQFDTSRRFFGGLAGNYRLYMWHNGRVPGDDGTPMARTGLGASVDQRIDDDWTLFGRYGREMQGPSRSSQALTIGAETDGSRWGRGADGIGLALGWIHGEDSRSDECPTDDVAELYYRYRLNDRVQLSPDVQWIRHAHPVDGTLVARTLGVRAKVAF